MIPCRHDHLIPRTCPTCLLATRRADYRRHWGLPDPVRKTEPKCGVSIGCHRWPALARLQVSVIREHCGDVPILLSVDAHSEERDSRYRELATIPGVTVNISKERRGHTQGDLQAFRLGLAWARRKGLAFVAKLSHRMILDIPNWLHDQAELLQQTGLATSGNRCVQNGKIVWPFRTEAVIMDTAQWEAKSICLCKGNAEMIFWKALQSTGSGNYLPWLVFQIERNVRNAGVLWHGINHEAEYWALAQRYGLLLDADFSCRASGLIEGYKS